MPDAVDSILAEHSAPKGDAVDAILAEQGGKRKPPSPYEFMAMAPSQRREAMGQPPLGFFGRMAEKVGQYTGVLPLAQNIARMTRLVTPGESKPFTEMTPQEKVQTGLDFASLGMGPASIAAFGPRAVGMAALRSAPALAAYGETVAPSVERAVEEKVSPEYPYAGEVLKMLPWLAVPGAQAAITGRIKGRPGVPVEPQRAATLAELESKGYPLTEAHLKPDDIRLKAIAGQPEAAEAFGRFEKLGSEALQKDIGETVRPAGRESTAEIGERFGKSFKEARDVRSQNYADMLERASAMIGPQITEVGKKVHAGDRFYEASRAILKKEGIDSKSAFQKIRAGKALADADIPVGSRLDPDSVGAMVRLADRVRSKGPQANMRGAQTPVQLDTEIQKFSKNQKLFEKYPDAQRQFAQGARQVGTRIVDKIIKRVDVMNRKLMDKPFYPEWVESKSQWAKYNDLVNEYASRFIPKHAKSGEQIRAEMRSPELIFEKDILGGGAERVKQFKSFLGEHKQDPKIIEEMAMDYLADKATKLDPKTNQGTYDPAALRNAWQKLSGKGGAMKEALFSDKTIKSIEDLLQREATWRKPLEVMGTKAKGESQTSVKEAIQRSLGSGAVFGSTGAGIGGLMGGPVGAVGGALAGMGAKSLKTALAKRKAGKFLFPRESPLGRISGPESGLQPRPRALESLYPGLLAGQAQD